MKLFNGGGSQQLISSTHSIPTKENKLIFFLFSFHSIDSLIDWDGNKKYYNSISRQSGIVHKDKAMRQLDLDLWEMN